MVAVLLMFFASPRGKDCAIEGMLYRYVVLGLVASMEWEHPIININGITQENLLITNIFLRILLAKYYDKNNTRRIIFVNAENEL